jgi:heme exporter protein A
MSDFCLKGENVHLWRGEHHVLRGVRFQAEGGECLQLTGANGAGKTTLLRAACGLAYPEGGEITWCGEDIRRDMHAFHSQLAYLGHEPPLKAELTTRENLHYWVGVRRRLRREELDQALDRIGGKDWADRPVRTLSAGQKRRAALAGLTLMRVPLWLLDEPTTHLDAEGQKLVGALIDEHLQAGGVAVAAVHHELAVSRGAQAVRRLELTLG